MANKLSRRIVAGLAVLAVSIAAIPAKAQVVVANPTTYDFFTVYIGQSAKMTGSVTNANGGTIFIYEMEWIYNPLDAFSITSPISVPFPLRSGESTDYEVTFTPPDFSFWNATLRIHTDSLSHPNVDITFWGFGDYPGPDPCSPLTNCGGICVVLDSDIANCGACSNVCDVPEHGSASCEFGVCSILCDLGYDAVGNACVPVDPCAPLISCGGTCVDLNSDIANCGICGNVCTVPDFALASCQTGVCDFECNLGYILEDGLCVPDLTDAIALMHELLVFFDESIADGTLQGTGVYPVSANRERILRHMLEVVLARIEGGQLTAACAQLDNAYVRTDGVRPQPDFVQGPASDDLADRIISVVSALGCAGS